MRRVRREIRAIRRTKGGTGVKVEAVYTDDFADSMKNYAVISPPDPANTPVFSFTPAAEENFRTSPTIDSSVRACT